MLDLSNDAAPGILDFLDSGVSPVRDACGDNSFEDSLDTALSAPTFPLEYGVSSFVSHLTTSPSALLNDTTHETSQLPSPYCNFLQIQRYNFQAARIQNALYLNVPLQLAQKAESIISPWYWHKEFARITTSQISQHRSSSETSHLYIRGNSPRTDIFVRPVRRRPCFSLSTSVMADLAPTELQQLQPHDMYIDLIPFPIFRDRAITLLNMTPPAFDESELKRDIESEGLLVWGVSHGPSDRASSLLRDRRNWECARWFAKKWRLLINGSGLEEQSKWWRRMRGDDESEDEEL